MDNNVVLTLRMEQLDSEDGDGIINTYPAKYRKVGDWHVFSYEKPSPQTLETAPKIFLR
ncbi:hypothetical protein [Clostridium sp. AM49-4BH]|uniref:hypothetical protein n=1 Tax=Clostridium sp. AM49-4BH TaxID=2293035 RepID=UPI0015F80911|nr:hypothetical protein [Clostridium sp. AM49-4BH]